MAEHCDSASESDGETFHAKISEMPSNTVEPVESSPPVVDNEEESYEDADLEALCAIGINGLINY